MRILVTGDYYIYNKHVWFVASAKFHKNQAHCNFETKSAQVFNLEWISAISNTIFMINELGLFWVSNLIALGIYFVFGTKFSWNDRIDTRFNVEYVLLGRNFDFFWWLIGGFCSLLSGYGWLLLVTASYFSFLLLVRTLQSKTVTKNPIFHNLNYNKK